MVVAVWCCSLLDRLLRQNPSQQGRSISKRHSRILNGPIQNSILRLPFNETSYSKVSQSAGCFSICASFFDPQRVLLDFDQHSQPPRAPIHEYDDNSSVGSVDSFGSTMGAYNNMRDIPPVGTVETGGGWSSPTKPA